MGAKSDAEEIKSHAWFKELDWEEVYQRKLKPPPPPKKIPKLDNVVTGKIEDIASTQEAKNHMAGWSFIKPEGF